MKWDDTVEHEGFCFLSAAEEEHGFIPVPHCYRHRIKSELEINLLYEFVQLRLNNSSFKGQKLLLMKAVEQ